MSSFKITFTPESAKTIRKFHPDIKKLIRQAIDGLPHNPFKGDELQGELSGFRSLKPRRYRIIYKVDEENSWIEIYHVGHRRDIYENFRRFLTQIRER